VNAQAVGVVEIAQTASSDLRELAGEGSLESEASMERFIRRRNVQLYYRLLGRVTDGSERQKIIYLLAEELLKQKEAADPPW
jgi:hypothetical protein